MGDVDRWRGGALGIITVLLRQEFLLVSGRRLCGGNSVGHPAGGFL